MAERKAPAKKVAAKKEVAPRKAPARKATTAPTRTPSEPKVDPAPEAVTFLLRQAFTGHSMPHADAAIHRSQISDAAKEYLLAALATARST